MVRSFINHLINLRLSFMLVMCLFLGGTSQYIYSYKFPLFILSILFIGLILSDSSSRKLSRLMQFPSMWLGTLVGLYIIYIIPLPVDLWSSLKGRELVITGYEVLNEALPPLPISLYPERTFFSLFDFIPIFAVGLITTLSNNEKEIAFAKFTVIGFSILSLVLGLLQIISDSEAIRLYDIYNAGLPLGFFSNTNHLACMLAMALPLTLATLNDRNIGSNFPKNALKWTTFAMLAGGILLTGSYTGYVMLLLLLPLCLSSITIVERLLKSYLVIFVTMLIVLISFNYIFSSELGNTFKNFTVLDERSRGEMIQTILSWQSNYGNLGIGPGAFEHVYRIHENPEIISRYFANNVHNDYIQIWLELGIFGLILVVGAITWLIAETKNCLIAQSTAPLMHLFAISLPLLHSVVDYPLRVLAISSLLAFLVALLGRNKFKTNQT